MNYSVIRKVGYFVVFFYKLATQRFKTDRKFVFFFILVKSL